ncbi:Ammonium transporter 1 member 1 (AtAMT1 [Durusdinium trenchii]|uniref:Ammonium transporter n=1 Tax=Durusdinium trenchii TaxID=1381693 RepID=A0ABP0SG09_9DINO
MSLDCSSLTEPDAITVCNALVSGLQDSAQVAAEVAGDTDVFFILWAAALVFMMHLGFAMLSAGAVRVKSTNNILMCIVLDACVCAIAFWLLGYGFAYGEDAGSFIGTSYFALKGIGEDFAYNEFFFQYAFAATAATIVSGAVAERATFESYLTYSLLLSIWVYPVVVHWVWGGGFLTLGGENAIFNVGVMDFAGCGPVHMIGGFAGAIGCKIIGPRIGRFDSKGRPLHMPGHSSPLAVLGTFVLWVGWFGFNPGSALTIIGSGQIAERAAVNTLMSSAGGALASLSFNTALNPGRDWDITSALNGVLAGLVSITAACAVVEIWAAVLIGAVGGILYILCSRMILNFFKMDDPLDAVAVHFCCGMYGLIVTGFFAKTEFMQAIVGFDSTTEKDFSGVFYGGNGKLLFSQLVEIVCIIAWTGLFLTPYFSLLKKLNLLRISADQEDIGIDHSSHGGSAYPDLYPEDEEEIAFKKQQIKESKSKRRVANSNDKDDAVEQA